MIGKLRGILEVIEYLDPSGREIVHRVPEEGSGEIVLGSQCIVRENQVASFLDTCLRGDETDCLEAEEVPASLTKIVPVPLQAR